MKQEFRLYKGSTVKRRGFTLIELLACLAIIAAMTALGARVLVPSGSGRVLKETSKLAGICELASQAAKSSNRAVYLFFRQDATKGTIYVAMVADREGADPFSAAGAQSTAGSTLELLTKEEQLSAVQLSTVENDLYAGRRLTHLSQNYDVSLRFAPTGQVEADPGTFLSSIRIGLQATRQSAETPPLVLRLASLTGMTQITQP